MDVQEIHLRDYLKVLKKRRFIIITFFIITVTVVVIGTFAMVPVYKAGTKILIEKNESNPLDNSSYIRFDPEFLETQYQIIKSFNVAKAVVKILALDTTYHDYFFPEESESFFSELKKTTKDFLISLLNPSSLEENDTTASETDSLLNNKTIELSAADQLAIYLTENIAVNPVRNTRIVSISFTEKNPVLASNIVNTFAKAYMEEVLEINMAYSSRKMKWMTKKAEEERRKLEKSEKALQKYMRQKDIITVENKITIIPQKLQDFSKRLTIVEEKRKELEEIKKKIDQLEGNYDAIEALPGFASNASLQRLRSGLLKTDQHIEELSKKYGKKHPAMIKAASEKIIFQDKWIQEIKKIINTKRNNYELALANERNLQTLLKNTKKEAQFLNENFIQHSILKREVESNRALYQSLIGEVKKQNMSNSSHSVNVWVVEPAMPPAFPDKPKKKINLLLALVLGLFGGIGLAFFIEYLDHTVKSVDELESKFNLKVLGTIPLFKAKKNKNPVESAVKTEPLSQIAESYKAVRTSILLSSADQPPKKLLLSSMSPQEGKSTSVANLSATMAENKQSVIVIDCDLRKPKIHKIFQLQNQVGVSTYLAGLSELEETLHQDPHYPSIQYMPSGPIPPNPSELLNSKKFAKLIKEMEKRHDFIILDSPPILNVTDSLILTKLVDGLIIVCKAGQTNYDSMTKGLKLLNNVQAPILGALINGVEKKHSGYYYYGYESYYGEETLK
jgi:polysaccharide biosynthesis transport protein